MTLVTVTAGRVARYSATPPPPAARTATTIRTQWTGVRPRRRGMVGDYRRVAETLINFSQSLSGSCDGDRCRLGCRMGGRGSCRAALRPNPARERRNAAPPEPCRVGSAHHVVVLHES